MIKTIILSICFAVCSLSVNARAGVNPVSLWRGAFMNTASELFSRDARARQ